MDDQHFMKMAIELAKSAEGQTHPNPMVGAVVVKNGMVVGMGAHLKAGTEHAEVHAINMAGEKAEDATLYVTLEPCSHYGKTPPCSDLIVKKKIKRVVVASVDPNPLVAGKGLKQLDEAGIQVSKGVMEKEALELNRAFFHFIKYKQPFVTAKLAMSLDGKIRTSKGESQWITSVESRRDGHYLRHTHDAILVGIETVLTDDPLLTIRHYNSTNHPVRVVLDHQLRIPADARLVTNKEALTWIFTLEKNKDTKKAHLLEEAGVKITFLQESPLNIYKICNHLGRSGLMTLLIEGGPTIQDAFFRAKSVHEVVSYIAPTIIGGSHALTAVEGQGFAFLSDSLSLSFKKIEQIGKDIKITASLEVE